jgi:hypothetical protein
MSSCGTPIPGARNDAPRVRSLGHLAENSRTTDRAIAGPRQGTQCVIYPSTKCSSDLESALALASHGGKLFYYEANIFRLMRRQALLSVLRYQYSAPRVPPMPQNINSLEICPLFLGLPSCWRIGCILIGISPWSPRRQFELIPPTQPTPLLRTTCFLDGPRL